MKIKIKKLQLLIVLGLVLISSCNNNDDDINCLTFDVEQPLLFVRIIDATGTNLIENGSIDPAMIDVKGDFLNASFQFIPANESGDVGEFDNTLALSIPNESTFQYTIDLENFETIILDFTAELITLPCNITFFEPVEVNLNTENHELMLFHPRQFLVVVEL